MCMKGYIISDQQKSKFSTGSKLELEMFALSLGQFIQKNCVAFIAYTNQKSTFLWKEVQILYLFALKSKLLLKILRYP